MIHIRRLLYSKKIIKLSDNSGFSLPEILVTLVIIGILGAVVAPSWLAFVDTQRLNTAQGEVYSAMRQAQSQAKKEKLTWQASFREHNGIVQWAVHRAEADNFIPDAMRNNEKLWQNLHPNVRIYQQRNDNNTSETTFPKESSQEVWRILFNHQGCPVYRLEDQCNSTSLRTLGQITFYSQHGGKTKRCVYLSTLLGAMRVGKDHTRANTQGKYCY